VPGCATGRWCTNGRSSPQAAGFEQTIVDHAESAQ
jgi:hypothetical protein